MLRIEDAHLPGLADLSGDRLRAITGADEVDLLRLRYRPGKRAILHVATWKNGHSTEGTLWFFGSDKGRRIARRNRMASSFDPETAALFEAFPQDHRMPQIRRFLADYEAVLQKMTGRRAGGAPVLLRYRPGLSCTFRCALDGPEPVYVKLINDDDPQRLQTANRAMQNALASSGTTVAPVLGIDRELGAVAYGSAPGLPLDQAVSDINSLAPLDRAIAGLRHFWAAPIPCGRTLDPEMLLARARESVDFVAITAPSCLSDVASILRDLEERRPDAPLRPIHADMKLEHVVLDADQTTLIDTESVSLGLPDYDLAQLFGRIWQVEQEGRFPTPLAEAAAAQVRSAAGTSFDWCLGIVAVRLAKFYAQRPGPDTDSAIRAILGRLA